MADPELGVGLALAENRLGTCGVRGGGGGPVWQGAVWPVLVVDVDEAVELGLQLGEGGRGWLGVGLSSRIGPGLAG